MSAPPWQPAFDELVAFATSEARRDEVLQGKAEFFEKTGEIFDDDRQFESRMAAMLEYLVFDRPSRDSQLTPAREYYLQRVTEGPPEKAASFRLFSETVHSLFSVGAIKQGLVHLEDLHDGAEYEVVERRALAGLAKGDVLEARLVPADGRYYFAPAFCFHPKVVAQVIAKEAKRRRKLSPPPPREALVWESAKRSLKADRYRNIALEKIYDFGVEV